jgi:sensor histidine kinase YesM
MGNKSGRKFSGLLIYPGFQLRYIAWITFSGLILSLGYFAIFYYYTRENYFALVELSLINDETKLQLYSELKSILAIMLGFTFLFLSVIAFVSLRFSHNIAGPIYKITSTIAKMRASNTIGQIQLRKKDEFKFLATEINELIEHLNKQKS